MNRDEIAQLSDKEIRLEIAKIKGWTIDNGKMSGWPPNGKLQRITNWPANDSAVCGLLDEMKLDRGGITFDPDDGNWWASFERSGTGETDWEAYPAPTRPRAICNAWLAWKGV